MNAPVFDAEETRAAIDDACRLLRACARDIGARGIEVVVLQDGRVSVEATDSKGFTRWRLQADIEPGGPLPTPGDVVAGVWRNVDDARALASLAPERNDR